MELNNIINKILYKYYPLPILLSEINNLSHFFIRMNNWNKFNSLHFTINGIIINGIYKDYKIKKVITVQDYSWKNYLLLYVSFLNNIFNPIINENKFLILIHTFSYLKELNMKELIIKKKDKIVKIKVNYSKNINYNLIWNNKKIKEIQNIHQNNHFYFNSFNIQENKDPLKFEINKLFKNRDNYNTLHFHLDNNGGGDLVPVHLILRCLIGNKKEKWMKNIKKIVTNKKIVEWNCWKEEDKNSPNYELIKELNIKTEDLEKYKNKYKGKIYLYMNKDNGSAAWFFITYLIYAFAKEIKRDAKISYGKKIKFGSIINDQLIIKGYSGTTSGDGNSIEKKYKNITILCPTEQFLECSIKKKDWNRFWIEEN